MAMAMRYPQQPVSLLTNHGKQRVIAPVLEQGLGCRICWVDGFDTDTLGSFSRETPRLTSALDTCRRKAEIGMGLAHASLGLASEGTFNADPWTGLPCAACGQPTRMATHALWRCAHCQHSQEVVLAQARNADPSWCDHCNP